MTRIVCKLQAQKDAGCRGSSRFSVGSRTLTLRVQVVLIYGLWYPKWTQGPIIGSTWTLRVIFRLPSSHPNSPNRVLCYRMESLVLPYRNGIELGKGVGLL